VQTCALPIYDAEVLDYDSSKPNSKTLEILKDRSNLNLTNVAQFLPQHDRWTNWYDKNNNGKIDFEKGEATAIDHILLSSNLISAIESVSIPNTVLYPSGNLNFSDHWPVLVTIDLSKFHAKKPKKQEPSHPSSSAVPVIVVLSILL